jgi:ketosteroid isomerase-like protein
VSDTRQIARRYFDAWTSGDADIVAAPLAEATRGARTIRVAEQLTVRDGQIASSVFVTDMAAFMAFASDAQGDRS